MAASMTVLSSTPLEAAAVASLAGATTLASIGASAVAPPAPATRFRRRTAQEIRDRLLQRTEIALLDVRDEHVFAQAHPLWAANLPLIRLELDAWRRLPRRDVPLVVYDNGEGQAEPAARRLIALGYTDVALLDKGLAGWREAGYECFQDVNAPSKAFGELVEAVCHTPSVPAHELLTWLEGDHRPVVLDARRFDEFQTMAIPGGVSVPGGELVRRAADLAPQTATRIVVNCAGRTRSIIGAQSLIHAGIPNPVVALRNGTIGWTLAGLSLAHGQTATHEDVPLGDGFATRQRVARWARHSGVRNIDVAQLNDWLSDTRRTTYLFDVRSAAEFERGHRPGFRHVPGGQLVQETDHHVPIRGARIVLTDNDGIRAPMAASWLLQMGWEVVVLPPQEETLTETGPAPVPAVKLPDGLTLADIEAASQATRYRRPYEGTDAPQAAMQAYLDWEFGLIAQLERDGTHFFQVVVPPPGATSPAEAAST
jgi:rhodanese-related sulfurtransferase